MLSGEGNEKGEEKKQQQQKNNRSNQQKSNFARAAHFFCTFFCRCFAPLKRETSRNFLVTRFMEEMSYVFLFTFFFTVAHFHPGGHQHFSFSQCRYKMLRCFSQKNVSFIFSNSLQLVFSLSFPALSPYFLFFFFSFSIFQICGHDN